MNAKTFNKFKQWLIKDAVRKTFIIFDNLRVHHSYVFKEWFDDYRVKIELFFLPLYSPGLNLDEYLNCHLNAGVHSSVPARTQKAKLQNKAIYHLRMLQKKPKRVKKYFEHPRIAYAI